jgi:hypothetical protein
MSGRIDLLAKFPVGAFSCSLFRPLYLIRGSQAFSPNELGIKLDNITSIDVTVISHHIRLHIDHVRGVSKTAQP